MEVIQLSHLRGSRVQIKHIGWGISGYIGGYIIANPSIFRSKLTIFSILLSYLCRTDSQACTLLISSLHMLKIPQTLVLKKGLFILGLSFKCRAAQCVCTTEMSYSLRHLIHKACSNHTSQYLHIYVAHVDQLNAVKSDNVVFAPILFQNNLNMTCCYEL